MQGTGTNEQIHQFRMEFNLPEKVFLILSAFKNSPKCRVL